MKYFDADYRKNLTPAWSDLFLAACQGVYTRMEMMPTYIRSGLFLNSTLAKLADSAVKSQSPTSSQDTRLPEDEKYELNVAANEWNEEMKTILKKGILQKAPASSEVKKEVDSTTYIVQSAYENAEKQSAQGLEFCKSSKNSEKSVSAAPLDSDDEEDFPQYYVDDAERNFEKLKVGEEPKTSVTPPAYVIDAFEMLLEKEKREVRFVQWAAFASVMNFRYSKRHSSVFRTLSNVDPLVSARLPRRLSSAVCTFRTLLEPRISTITLKRSSSDVSLIDLKSCQPWSDFSSQPDRENASSSDFSI